MARYYDAFLFTYAFSVTGLPSMSVHCGFTNTGIPVGLQIVGRPHEEARVLAVAERIQALRPIGLPSLEFRA